MKALKEKRISLRSLLRRSLVILSLLALVFVSCGDSSSDDNNNSGVTGNYTGPEIETVIINGNNLPVQYLGRPINLTGITATIIYKDRNIAPTVNDELWRFSTTPKIFTGAYCNVAAAGYAVGDFVPMDSCNVTFIAPDNLRSFATDVSLTGVGIWRDATNTQGVIYDPITGLPTASTGYDDWNRAYAQGVQITGVNSPIRQRTAYADDDTFDFSGLVLEADYYDGTKYELSFDDIILNDTWRIIPDYEQGKNSNGVYPGYIYITIGQNLYYSSADNHSYINSGFMGTLDTRARPTDGQLYFGGITVLFPLDEVYTVAADPTWAEPENLPENNDYMFYLAYEPTTAGADQVYWGGVFGEQLMRVQYTGNMPDKVFTINQWYNKRDVWWNRNFNYDNWTTQPPNSQQPNARPLAIKGPDIPFDVKRYPNPSVKIYYRGWQLDHKIDVYTRLVGYGVTPEEPTFNFTRDSGRDNDNPGLATGASVNGWHSGLVFTVTYMPYNDIENDTKAKDFVLSYAGFTNTTAAAATFTGPSAYTLGNIGDGGNWLTYTSNFQDQILGYLVNPANFTPIPGLQRDRQLFDGLMGEATKYAVGATRGVRLTHFIDRRDDLGVRSNTARPSLTVTWTTDPNVTVETE